MTSLLFNNPDGTLEVCAGVVLEPSDTTPEHLLEAIPFWHVVEKWHSVLENGQFDTEGIFFGHYVADHLQVLSERLTEVLPTLGELIKHDAKVTIKVWWIGSADASPPSISLSDLGELRIPGVTLDVEVYWDLGYHVADSLRVSLSVYGPHPDEVSALLGEPTTRLLKGARTVSKTTGKESIQRCNVWSLECGGYEPSSTPSAQIKALFQKLGPSTKQWREYAKKPDTDVRFELYWAGVSGATEPILDYTTLKKIGSYCAHVQKTAYYFLPDLESPQDYLERTTSPEPPSAI